jgi:hypothetical protein
MTQIPYGSGHNQKMGTVPRCSFLRCPRHVRRKRSVGLSPFGARRDCPRFRAQVVSQAANVSRNGETAKDAKIAKGGQEYPQTTQTTRSVAPTPMEGSLGTIRRLRR